MFVSKTNGATHVTLCGDSATRALRAHGCTYQCCRKSPSRRRSYIGKAGAEISSDIKASSAKDGCGWVCASSRVSGLEARCFLRCLLLGVTVAARRGGPNDNQKGIGKLLKSSLLRCPKATTVALKQENAFARQTAATIARTDGRGWFWPKLGSC